MMTGDIDIENDSNVGGSAYGATRQQALCCLADARSDDGR